MAGDVAGRPSQGLVCPVTARPGVARPRGERMKNSSNGDEFSSMEGAGSLGCSAPRGKRSRPCHKQAYWHGLFDLLASSDTPFHRSRDLKVQMHL